MIIFAIIAIVIGILKVMLSFALTGELNNKLKNLMSDVNDSQLATVGFIIGIDGLIQVICGAFIFLII